MKNSMKIALWEFKKNVLNKTFIISIIITPLIFFFFAFIPTLLERFESSKVVTLYIIDELDFFTNLSRHFDEDGIELVNFTGDIEELKEEISGQTRKGIVFLYEESLKNKEVIILFGGEGRPNITKFENILKTLLEIRLLSNYSFTEEEINHIQKDFRIIKDSLIIDTRDRVARMVPFIFSILIVFAIYITGMMILQSSIQEKKDKMVELLLSSVKSEDLMYGKMIGFFLIGLLQITVWVGFGIPAMESILKINIATYLISNQTILLFIYWLAGYTIYSLIFASIGATLDDIQSANNFQGLIFMLPIIPVVFIPALTSDPNGFIARLGSFIPFTTPGVMLLRLGFSSNVPVLDIIISLIIIIISIIFISYIATKIFKTGMLLYGKNPSIKEIWKWLRY